MTVIAQCKSVNTATRPTAHTIEARVAALDWHAIAERLDSDAYAVLELLLTPDEWRSMAALYRTETRFCSRVVMARHSFGRGEYKYFAYPLSVLLRLARRDSTQVENALTSGLVWGGKIGWATAWRRGGKGTPAPSERKAVRFGARHGIRRIRPSRSQ